MKPQKSKKEQSRELKLLIQAFVESGGEVTNVPKGKSGNEDNRNLFHASDSGQSKPNRTPVTDVVKTLEERKQNKNISKERKTKRTKAGKRLIVDDFGDPVRWVWDE